MTASFLDWTLRNGKRLWIVALLLAIPAVGRSAWLYAHLKSDLEELLPREAPSVVALDALRGRLGGTQYLGVVVDAGSESNVPAAEHLLDDLAIRVRAYPKDVARGVRTGAEEERAFLEKHAALYMDIEDLFLVRDRIKDRHAYEVARATGTLLDDDPPPSVDMSDLEKKYAARIGGGGGGGGGSGEGNSQAGRRFTNGRDHLTVMLIEVDGYSSGAKSAERLIRRVQSDIDALGGPDRYAPGMRIGYAGDAAIASEEMSALVADLSISSILVLLAVIAAIVIYYRWWRSVLILAPPLLIATAYSFAIASLPPFDVTSLNSNTAFLGSIIVGNGINASLIVLARYVEERRKKESVRTALERALKGSLRGTLAASAAAAVSYASLGVTAFRGFRQFGVIGALGMMLAWGAAFLLMPPLVLWLDHGETTRPRRRTERTRASYWVSRLVAKAPRVIAGATIAMTVVGGLELSRFRASDIESDFSRLRRRDTWTQGEGFWGKRMDQAIGQYLSPLVILANDRDEATRIGEALKQSLDRAPFKGRIDSIRTADDVLPKDQAQKIAAIQEIKRALTPNVRSRMTEAQRKDADRFLDADLQPIGIAELPRTFTLGLMERDGTIGRTVLVYPNPLRSWDGDSMRSLVADLRDVAESGSVAGAIPLSADIIEAIRSDGPIASTFAFFAVLVVVVLLLRRRDLVFAVAASLFAGVVWLAGGSRLLGIRINFANFIAFPITLGIGVDYAVNVMSRYAEDGRKDVLQAVRSTGSAVALCSLTTIIGYASLLLAENQALFNFGVLAVLGEICCLSAALVGLPAFLRLGYAEQPADHGTWHEPLHPPRKSSCA